MSMIQNAAIFPDAPPAAVLQPGRGTTSSPRASAPANGFAHLLQGRRASRGESTAEKAVKNQPVDETDTAPSRPAPASVKGEGVQTLTTQQVGSERKDDSVSKTGGADTPDLGGLVSQFQPMSLTAEALKTEVVEVSPEETGLSVTSNADKKQAMSGLTMTNGAAGEESLTADAMQGGVNSDAAEKGKANVADSILLTPVKTKVVGGETAASSHQLKRLVEASQGAVVAGATRVTTEARPEASAAVIPAEREQRSSPAVATASGQLRSGFPPIQAADAQLMVSTSQPAQDVTASGSNVQQESGAALPGGRPGGPTAEGFVPTPVGGGFSQASPAAPLAGKFIVQEESWQPAAATSATEGAQKEQSVSAEKVQGSATAVPLVNQQPVQVAAEKGVSSPEKDTQAAADRKDTRAAEGMHRIHGAEKGVEEQAGVTPKASEVASGVKTAAADSAVKPAPLQGSAGQDGSGDAGKKGHPEQNAQGKLHDIQTSGFGVQGPGLAEAPQPETKPISLKSSLHESVLSQIKEGVVTHDGKGNGQMSIRLNPGELGEVKIQVRMDDNRLRIEVQADNRMVKDLLMNNLDSLKEALSGKNFTMEGFDVSTGGGGFNRPLQDEKGSSRQQSTLRSARAGGYPGQDEGQVNYLTEDVNNLLDVRF